MNPFSVNACLIITNTIGLGLVIHRRYKNGPLLSPKMGVEVKANTDPYRPIFGTEIALVDESPQGLIGLLSYPSKATSPLNLGTLTIRCAPHPARSMPADLIKPVPMS